MIFLIQRGDEELSTAFVKKDSTSSNDHGRDPLMLRFFGYQRPVVNLVDDLSCIAEEQEELYCDEEDDISDISASSLEKYDDYLHDHLRQQKHNKRAHHDQTHAPTTSPDQRRRSSLSDTRVSRPNLDWRMRLEMFVLDLCCPSLQTPMDFIGW